MRVTNAVSATSVPIEMLPSMTWRPPSRYTAAVPIAPTSAIITRNHREYMAERMPMSRTPAALVPNSPVSRSWSPNSLTSWAPDTPNRSVICAFMSAFSCMESRVMAWSRRPTRLDGMRKSGSRRMATIVMRQSRAIIATSVNASVITLDTTVPNVPVSARCAPITSLLRRLTIAPVCDRVKNCMGMRCTWSNSALRRS